jgi:hypothetical protein
MAQDRLTRLQRQIERHLNESLADYVAKRRADGLGWRTLSEQITEKTGVEVSYEALRAWFGDRETAGTS